MKMRSKPRRAGTFSYDQKPFPSIKTAADYFATSVELDEDASWDPHESFETIMRVHDAYLDDHLTHDEGEVPVLLGDLEVGGSDVVIPVEVWREACHRAVARKVLAALTRLWETDWHRGVDEGNRAEVAVALRALAKKKREYRS
jgi:hypothetical protein